MGGTWRMKERRVEGKPMVVSLFNRLESEADERYGEHTRG